MHRIGSLRLVSVMVGIVACSTVLFGQKAAAPFMPSSGFGARGSGASPVTQGRAGFGNGILTPPINSYFYPSWDYGLYASPFLYLPSPPLAPYAYVPNYWWTGAYPIADPRQSGYNPSAGYRWEDVGTLLLATSPAKTRVTLDGVFVGTTDQLGPIQLPAGEHALRIELSGYEPSETILKIEQPIVQQLDIRLNPVTRATTGPGQ
jgi:hypothetical protein